MINDDKLYLISSKLSELLKSKSIPFKETEKQFTILCPSCLKDGKTKLKLNIDKKSYIYHCFRCGIKGSALTLPTVLNQLGLIDIQHLFLDIITDVRFLRQQKKSFYQTYIDINTELDNDFNKNLYKSQILKNVKSTLNVFNACYDKNKHNIKNLIKTYLQSERNIEPYQLNIHKINHLYCTDGKLNCRFVVPTYLHTNYEARTITESINRYMKEEKYENALFLDFVFINLVNGIQDNPFKRKKELILPYVIVTEGLFDALKLGLMNFPTVSSGGIENFNKVLLFLLILDKLFNIKVKNILYIYDKDINMNKIEEVRSEMCFSFSKYYNLIFSRFNYETYKDIGEIPNAKMYDFINELDNVIYNFK